MDREGFMKRVRVELNEKSYDVRIGRGIIADVGTFLRFAKSKRAFIVADERLKTHRAKVLASFKKAGWQAVEVPVKAGESLKELKSLYPLYGEMIKAGVDRSSVLVALGGGSVGDAAGFLASTYMRGIPWVGLPTTLLAQVDSAVGGKTAVNHPLGKNLIGTFHQPALVVCDTGFLKTLSEREVISGLGEVIKYGLVYDRRLFQFIRKNWSKALKLDDAVLTELVQKSTRWKAKAVAEDEFDRSGVREVLNFGHTFGHALESVTRYKVFQHGEAVLWGMRFASALSVVTGRLALKTFQEMDGFLKSIPLPALPKRVASESYFEVMKKDKKAQNGRVRFVLLKNFENTELDRNITTEQLEKAFAMIGAR
jgi:3-dehydroquinate synthase